MNRAAIAGIVILALLVILLLALFVGPPHGLIFTGPASSLHY